MDLNRTIHEPARLKIMMILAGVESADFVFLLNTIGLTRGNLSAHMSRLERQDYVAVTKSFRGKIPHTDYQITAEGQKALDEYWHQLDLLRNSALSATWPAHLGRAEISARPLQRPRPIGDAGLEPA